MRFREFVEPKPTVKAGYYTVGDSMAQQLAHAGTQWVSKAQTGAISSSPAHKQALDSIPKGSVVAISVGSDDQTSTDTPEQIAANAKNLVSYAQGKGLWPVFVLLPPETERAGQIRDALKNSIKTPMLDVASNQGTASLSTIASQITSVFKPGKGYVQPSAGGTKMKAGKGATVSPSEVSAYLTSKGLDNNHVLGILANIKGESGFNAGVVGDHGTSGGLFQHHADRWRNMINYVGSDWRTDWKGQIDFALSEPAGKSYLRQKFSSPQEAVAWWVKYFEKPADMAGAINTRSGFLRNLA